ncbi:MAG: general secretion pathway protein GspK [Nitrospirae bacterium]|nr:general secretion pathway protein GspK [Nitrospirota bacterium]
MRSRKGYVLVIVLLILAVTTAAVIHFAGTVYGYVNTANNFNESERMSLLVKSAYILTAEKAAELLSQTNFSDQRVISFEEKIEDTTVGLFLEDNNSKFNVNLLGSGNPVLSETSCNIFRRLLRELKISEEYADRLADFIDADNIPRVPGGEDRAKNQLLFSLSELSYIFPDDVLKAVEPYITVFGSERVMININTADLPLLKSLHPEMTDTLARRIIEVRESKPFIKTADLLNVPGMEKIGYHISDLITVKSTSYNVTVKAERNDLIETAEAGFDLGGGRAVLKYWREQ